MCLELQKKLELLGKLIPIASQSVEKYRDTKLSIADIADELGGVKYIVQGNVLRDKNKVKVFVSLVDAANDLPIIRLVILKKQSYTEKKRSNYQVIL